MPGSSKVRVNSPPGASSPESEEVSPAVTVCGAPPSLTHSTASPGAIRTTCWAKTLSSVLTVAPYPSADAGAARGATSHVITPSRSAAADRRPIGADASTASAQRRRVPVGDLGKPTCGRLHLRHVTDPCQQPPAPYGMVP